MKLGSLVAHKSGGTIMTIAEIHSNSVLCQSFENGDVVNTSLAPSSIRVVQENNRQDNIALGDYVLYNSGGPILTVIELNNNVAMIQWLTQNGQYKHSGVYVHTLTKPC